MLLVDDNGKQVQYYSDTVVQFAVNAGVTCGVSQYSSLPNSTLTGSRSKCISCSTCNRSIDSCRAPCTVIPLTEVQATMAQYYSEHSGPIALNVGVTCGVTVTEIEADVAHWLASVDVNV
jgi:hypothetical protein